MKKRKKWKKAKKRIKEEEEKIKRRKWREDEKKKKRKRENLNKREREERQRVSKAGSVKKWFLLLLSIFTQKIDPSKCEKMDVYWKNYFFLIPGAIFKTPPVYIYI